MVGGHDWLQGCVATGLANQVSDEKIGQSYAKEMTIFQHQREIWHFVGARLHRPSFLSN